MDTDYRISGDSIVTRRHDRFMSGNDWLKIGVIIVKMPVYADGILNVLFVNMIGDENNTYEFHQVGHIEARFGRIIYVKKYKKRIDKQDNTIVRECRARFLQKSKMRFDRTRPMEDTIEWYSGMPVYKNGERIGGYDEDIIEKQKRTAFMNKQDRLKMEAKLREEKKQFLLNRTNIERKQREREEKMIDPAKVPTISTAQPTAKKKIALVPYIQMYPQNIGRLSVESEKKYILTDDRQLVEIS